MLRRDVEELKEKTWELDSTTRNNLGNHSSLQVTFSQGVCSMYFKVSLPYREIGLSPI
jgi:hypothetical protein